MKKGCAILFLILTFCCYGQNSTLLQNIDFRAEELEHSLNKTGDTLILNSERTIDKVDIFNGNLEKTFIINDTSTKISLDEFPNGRYVTQVKVHDKLIIITLLRHSSSDKSLAKIEKKDLEEEFSDSNLEIKNSSEGKQLKANLSTKDPIKIVKFYWIVKNINKGHSSSKQMRIGNKKDVERMIAQHGIDLKSKAGKRNQLTIWEVYDTTAFMRLKRRNPDYATIEESECFNTIPYYDSKGEDI